MHMALRAPADSGLKAALGSTIDDAAKLAAAERDRMRAFVTAVHDGSKRGATGERFTDVVNIGIGGSDLGPRVATEALTTGRTDSLMTAHFLSNVDGHAMADVVKGARSGAHPGAGGVEVLHHAGNRDERRGDAGLAGRRAGRGGGRRAFRRAVHQPEGSRRLRHPARACVRLPRLGRRALLAVVAGRAGNRPGRRLGPVPANAGRRLAMDCHFRDAPLRACLPVLQAWSAWHVNALGCATQCVLAYDDRLRRLPAHLQQVEMESNGNTSPWQAQPVEDDTCPILFGEPGTNAQHSFMQLVHQGTRTVPVDFILAACPTTTGRRRTARSPPMPLRSPRRCCAAGRRRRCAPRWRAKGASPAEIDAAAPHRVCVGERPSNTILFRRLDAFSVGRLIALYEHSVAVQGCIWGIDSFDQWGVELGKELAAGSCRS